MNRGPSRRPETDLEGFRVFLDTYERNFHTVDDPYVVDDSLCVLAIGARSAEHVKRNRCVDDTAVIRETNCAQYLAQKTLAAERESGLDLVPDVGDVRTVPVSVGRYHMRGRSRVAVSEEPGIGDDCRESRHRNTFVDG